MKTRFSVIFYFLFPFFASAQWFETFSETQLNSWVGDTSDFYVNQSNELQLAAKSAGESVIFKPFKYSSDSMFWTIYCKLAFDPSASNKLRIYLAADIPNPVTSEGYFLEIGENGNEDRWHFFARQNNSTTLLGSGLVAKLSSDPAECRFSIKRIGDTLWQVSTVYSKTKNLILEAELFDPVQLPIKDSYFGLQCLYTDTRKDKFIFDEIGIRTHESDTIKPFIIKAEIVDELHLKIEFNEPTIELQSLDITNYSIDLTHHPLQVDKSTTGETTYILTFEKAFKSEIKYRLHYKNIQDISGNIVPENQSIEFKSKLYHYAKSGDLLINEFMADPSPSAGLPETEFIELLNISGKTLQLKNLSIADGSSISENFPEFILEPGSMIILYHKPDSNLFNEYGKAIGLFKFPTINNSAEILRLFDAQNELIHEVNFSDSWYQNSFKKNGGYSLELKKPLQSCKGVEVWGPSEHILGGTPGKTNTGYDLETDQIAPILITYHVPNEYEIELIFNESLDAASVQQTGNYTLNDLLPASADVHATENQKVILFFEKPFQDGNIYTLNIKNIRDCSQNDMSETSIEISIPAEPLPGDLVWNEILFNPETGGEDFVEIYNKSNKAISLREIYLSNPLYEPRYIKLKSDHIVLPQSYVALTSDKLNLMHVYPNSDDQHIVETEMPSLDDAKGILLLAIQKNNNLMVIDSLEYSEDWHNPLLIDKEGVSLEKINPCLTSANKNHWQSSSAGANYATPGTKNSQYLEEIHKKDLQYSIPTHVISPNQDGYRDFLGIEFNLDLSGYKIKAEIYDLSGQLICVLSHQILGPQDVLKWNATDLLGQKVPSGNYILIMQLVHPEGSKHTYKELIVVDSGKK